MFAAQAHRLMALLALHVGVAHCFSWDFVVARANTLEFYNNGTLEYSTTPTTDQIEWLIYDPVHDRILFVEENHMTQSVSTFDIATKKTQSLIVKKPKKLLEKFAYDPATALLFGSAANNIFSFFIKPGNNTDVKGDFVIHLGSYNSLNNIAIDSCGGYIYWTAGNIIERALFDGFGSEIIIDRDVAVKQGLTVDTQRIYWIEFLESTKGGFSIESADLNGKNRRTLYNETEPKTLPDQLTISKDFITWGDNDKIGIFWSLPKNPTNYKEHTNVQRRTIMPAGSYGYQNIAAKYTIEERTQGVSNCNALKSLLSENLDCRKADEKQFCVYGTKVSGESRCECLQGYIGERCDVSICHNYCFQGDCYVTAEGQPKCRCNSGYSREKCEFSLCHEYCLNSGVCSLNNHSEPVCQCPESYAGERCDISNCKEYCLQGNFSVSAEGRPECRCEAGYSGGRCEFSLCHEYCLNDGVCSLKNHSEPVCQCPESYAGERCDISICKEYCLQGNCSVSADGRPKCRCNAGYSGEKCEVSLCHEYCLNSGVCSLNNHSEPVCQCPESYAGERCDISICREYCLQGNCSVSADGRPECRCNAGYSGERCHVDSCHDYCLNAGICSLNNNGTPMCHCAGQYEGDRCAVLPAITPKKLHEKYQWLPLVDGDLPANAMICGAEIKNMYPGKYVHSLGIGYFSWMHMEQNLKGKNEIKILSGTNAQWVQAYPKDIPKNAFIGGSAGREDYGEPLYIGRAMIDGKLACGKVYHHGSACYFPYYDKEVQMSSCEILVEPDDK